MKKIKIKVSDSIIITRLFLLSNAICEILHIEEQISNEFRNSKQQFIGRTEYFSFWLRCQSFFVTAKSLTDCKNLDELYNKKSDADWRFGVKAIRNFFAHEVDVINSLHHAVTFIPEEKKSISLTGFVINTKVVFRIFQRCSKNDLKRDFFRLKEEKKLTCEIVRKKLNRSTERNLFRVKKIASRPNCNVVLISDLITKHYLLISELTNDIKNNALEKSKDIETKSEVDEQTILYIENIEKTISHVTNYRNRNCNWNIN